MKKPRFTHVIADIFSSSKTVNILIFIVFAVLFTALLSSKYFFFQSIVNDDNTSRTDVTAPKTIEVVDSFKTEQRKNEVYQKIDPILTPAEDSYIKNNLDTLLNSIRLIRKKPVSRVVKESQIDSLIDIPESNRKHFIINYFLSVNETSLQLLSANAKKDAGRCFKRRNYRKRF